MLESKFQSDLIKELKEIFPGCIVLKNDPTYLQGVPDLSLFWGKHWAMLECKNYMSASKRPNQQYYVNKADTMSFSRFICPENRKEVIDDLQRAFGLK